MNPLIIAWQYDPCLIQHWNKVAGEKFPSEFISRAPIVVDIYPVENPPFPLQAP